MIQQNSGLLSDRQAPSADSANQFLTFLLSDEVYGIGILHIREIREYGNLTVIPLMPDFISGVINLRGNILPVVNLARRFELQPCQIGKRTSIIILDIMDNEKQCVEVGIVVDVVNEVIELADSDIAEAPAFGGKIRADFIKSMEKIDNKLMKLLEVDHVLEIDERSKLAGISSELNT